MNIQSPIVPNQPPAAVANNITLLHDTGGPITELAISIIEETLSDCGRRTAYESLLAVIAASTATVVVVTGASLENRVTAWLNGQKPPIRYTILAVPDAAFQKSDVWPRDATLCAKDQSGARRFLHPNVAIAGDLATWLAKHEQINLTGLNICLDGGDSLVIDDDHWIVGAGAVRSSLYKSMVPDWKSAPQIYGTTVGRSAPVIAGYRLDSIPLSEQWKDARVRAHRKAQKHHPHRPVAAHFESAFAATIEVLRDVFDADAMGTAWDHIDMVVSVTGVYHGTRPVILVADPMGKGCPSSESARIFSGKLSNLAAGLQDSGFDVIRNPAPCVDQLVLGCNNTVVQPPDTVWLPVFGGSLKKADDENVRVWLGLGFTNVKQVPGWQAYNKAQGCIRCATLPLKR